MEPIRLKEVFMNHGFIKVATVAPTVHLADTHSNVSELIKYTKEADSRKVQILVFPALSVTGATCADLFLNSALLNATTDALKQYLKETADTTVLTILGFPWSHNGKLYRCSAVCQSGRFLGIVPNQTLSPYAELHEARVFVPYRASSAPQEIQFDGQSVPFGTDLLFCCKTLPAFQLALHAEGATAFCGNPFHGEATVICIPSAYPEAIGRTERFRQNLQLKSADEHCAIIAAAAGDGESTTDAVFGGACFIFENGTLLSQRKSFDTARELVITEIDLDRLVFDRRKTSVHRPNDDLVCPRIIPFSLPVTSTALTRRISQHPFIPDESSTLFDRCEQILTMQTAGLKQRMLCSHAQKMVIGISGGLDSTLALLVAVRVADALSRRRTDVIAVTMPCFGTTARTKTNATVLCEELGIDFRCVDIFDSVNLHFHDIGHDSNNRNVTYENAQARERTQILMDIANDCNGLVIGTGDLSELALGWATYNGDHMSMYSVNADIPKTLIRRVVTHVANIAERSNQSRLATALHDVVDTPVSPELLPANDRGSIAQKTEDLVGPYELHDFYLYYMLRFGFSPSKLYRLAQYAFCGTYDNATLLKWLKIFLRRFFAQQFKRSCLPDGPRIGTVGLSPRSGWCMPSDASSAVWLAELDAL